jgi:hypothetical protein
VHPRPGDLAVLASSAECRFPHASICRRRRCGAAGGDSCYQIARAGTEEPERPSIPDGRLRRPTAVTLGLPTLDASPAQSLALFPSRASLAREEGNSRQTLPNLRPRTSGSEF